MILLWELVGGGGGGPLKSTACGRNVDSQIKWLSCMFTSIFGDISMTIQAGALLAGELGGGGVHLPRGELV